ncbi:hypothetical protein [Pseudonocardia sp. T1-2H]|uniref:hypothetical protein n=1 Tax=Pseudonocardia sp. T1-2H TaxID=3128899 RepID=UPI003100C2E7
MDVHVFDRTDPRLGRHQVHDPASRAFSLTSTALPVQPVMHTRHVPIFDQGQVGSCTGNAGIGMLVTGPNWRGKVYTEADAVELYHEETLIDDREIPGHYPPDDTGSAGIYSAKALKARGLISGYRHGFTVTAALAELALRPITVGIPWLNSMFEPAKDGVVPVLHRSGVAGGHQICFDGIDPGVRRVRFANSWGAGWGKDGWGFLSYTDFAWLLSQGGDVTAYTVV